MSVGHYENFPVASVILPRRLREPIAAIYHFGGSRHSFTALVHVEQTGLHAAITGVVTDGWRQGRLVSGEYTQITCSHDGLTTDCFRGHLELGRGGGG